LKKNKQKEKGKFEKKKIHFERKRKKGKFGKKKMKKKRKSKKKKRGMHYGLLL
jgi:hypothetical protein